MKHGSPKRCFVLAIIAASLAFPLLAISENNEACPSGIRLNGKCINDKMKSELPSVSRDDARYSISPSFLEEIRKSQKMSPEEVVKLIQDSPIGVSVGVPGAPVHLVIFQDLSQEKSRKLFREEIPALRDAFVSRGLLLMEFREGSVGQLKDIFTLGRAAQCASEQDSYLHFVSYLAKQNPLSVQNLDKYSRSAGLNEEVLQSCMNSTKYQDSIRKNNEILRTIGINDLPAVFINGYRIPLRNNYKDLRSVTESEVSKASY